MVDKKDFTKDWENQFYSKAQYFLYGDDGTDYQFNFILKNINKDAKILELGCGPGRNALYLAKKGCVGDAIDISKAAINWAQERAGNNDKIKFHHDSIFKFDYEPGSYDFIYDAGFFNHLFPHRRMQYLDLIKKVLRKTTSKTK